MNRRAKVPRAKKVAIAEKQADEVLRNEGFLRRTGKAGTGMGEVGAGELLRC